jgi:hypothetical protein
MVKSFSKNAAVGGMAPQRARTGLALTGLACGFCLAMAAAQAEDFTFSFSEGPSPGPAGTVNGEIFGLNSSGTSAATQVDITSTTPALSGMPTLPVYFNTNSINSFTVSGGMITAAEFGNDAIGHTNIELALNYFGTNQLEFSPHDIYNSGGFSAITFATPPAPSGPTSPVPELPVPLMLSFATLLPLLARRLRKADPRFQAYGTHTVVND